MGRLRFSSALCAALLLIGITELPAQTVTYSWTGRASSNDWYVNANWVSSDTLNTAPPNQPAGADTSVVVFGDLTRTRIFASHDVYANKLVFTGITQPYLLDGELDGPSYLSATFLGSGGIDYMPAQPVRSVIFTDFEFTDSQTWHVASGTLVLQGHIYDGDSGYTFTKTGAGTLVLGYNNNEFDTSTVVHNDGRLVLTASDPYSNYHPLGSAALVIGPASGSNNPVLGAADPDNTGGNVTLNNNVTLNGVLTTENQAELHFT
ncbi:MAG: motif protein, partial [Lacunisphaera sp.]|nr:motif protein [Lacunisphaera sp.]